MMTTSLGEVWEFLLLLRRQFAGGPGPPENNLVRFGLSIVMWALLWYVAWSRQRSQPIPRERLLLWGFGLALGRALFNFAATIYQIMNLEPIGSQAGMHQPVEHALAMAAVAVVAGAFLRYMLDNEKISQQAYNNIIYPVGNSLHILAIPLLGYVYLKEQASEKERAEASLSAYRDHLEELVEARTTDFAPGATGTGLTSRAGSAAECAPPCPIAANSASASTP